MAAPSPVEKAQDKHRSFLKATPLGVPAALSSYWVGGGGVELGRLWCLHFRDPSVPRDTGLYRQGHIGHPLRIWRLWEGRPRALPHLWQQQPSWGRSVAALTAARRALGRQDTQLEGGSQDFPQWSLSFKALVTVTKTKIVSPSPQSGILPRQAETIFDCQKYEGFYHLFTKITENILN